MKKEIALINGPNLNLLGTRNPEIYGTMSLAEIVENVTQLAKRSGFTVQHTQSNSEGEIIDAIQQAGRTSSGVLINPGAYSHTSIAIRDALECLTIPVIEVHLSNIYKRENFRRQSVVSEVVNGVISGFGPQGYTLALEALVELMKTS